MRRCFARSFKQQSTVGSGDVKRNQALTSKLYHMDKVDHFYSLLQDNKNQEDAINRMVNGNEVIFFKHDKLSYSQTESLINHFQKLRPGVGIDVDNHMIDYHRISFDSGK